MKTILIRDAMIRLVLIAGLFSYVSSCTKGVDVIHDPNFGQIDTTGGTAPYNLNVIPTQGMSMHGLIGKSLGFLKFRQKDTTHVISLDTWLFDLEPNHSYLLQRAVNPITDSSCSSTAWLTLGLGLTPQAIHTDKFGFGYEPLYRNVSSIPSGTQFRIHFQIVDSATKATVLTSDCFSYTVK